MRTPIGGETHSFDPRDVEHLKRMRAWADETIEKHLTILRDGISARSPLARSQEKRINEAHSYFSKTAAEQGADHGEQYGFKHRLYAQGVEECYICALLRENAELRSAAKDKP